MRYKAYPKYKDSGVEWLGDVPEGWDNTFLKFKIINLNFKRIPISASERENISGEYPYYGASGIIDYVEDYIFNETTILIGEDGANLLSKSTPLAFIAKDKYWVNNHAHILKPKDSLFDFWTYVLNSIDLTPFITGSAQPKLTAEALSNLQVVFPKSLKERIGISNYLNEKTKKIDTLIEKQKSLIELLKEKRQALISHVVTKGLDSDNSTWNKYRLDWVTTIVRGNTGFKKDELLKNGKYVALQYGKTYKVDEVNKEFNFYVNDEFYKFSQVVHYGNTILVSTSETIKDLGHSCFYNRNDLGLIGGEQILLKPNSKLLSGKYLYYKSKVFSNELRKYATGLKVFRFNVDDVKSTFILIPNMEEQTKIALYLDQKTKKIDTLIDKSTQSIALLKERRVALVSAVVGGKVDVGEWEVD